MEGRLATKVKYIFTPPTTGPAQLVELVLVAAALQWYMRPLMRLFRETITSVPLVVEMLYTLESGGTEGSVLQHTKQ